MATFRVEGYAIFEVPGIIYFEIEAGTFEEAQNIVQAEGFDPDEVDGFCELDLNLSEATRQGSNVYYEIDK